jgi:polysaccharide export outer membrane protein
MTESLIDRRPRSARRRAIVQLSIACVALALLGGCAQLPSDGPSEEDIAAADRQASAVQVVDIDEGVARQLIQEQRFKPFASDGAQKHDIANIGRGDTLEVDIWEAPPATLFGGSQPSASAPSTVHSTSLPPQMVDGNGDIIVPYAGRIHVDGRPPEAVQAEIVKQLRGKAHDPEVLVRVAHNVSSTVTVVGEVVTSVRMPLTPAGEHLLDALAAAGGVRQPVNKMTLQVTRGQQYQSLPLDLVIRDPRQNIALQPGDVVTAIFQPLSFTALGATTKNDEITFEAQGISLAQAIARAGGLIDSRSNPEAVFVFRLEQPGALKWPHQPVATTPDNMVPVVYRLNLRAPAAFFAMRDFPIRDKDIVYVSNAPAAELQKFLNLIFSLVYPLTNVYSVTR